MEDSEKDEYEKWLERARKDLKAGKDNVDTENFEWAAFQSHQAAEKALKSLYIRKHEELWKIHDLVTLAEELEAPENIVGLCDELNPHYIVARYPVQQNLDYEKEEAEDAVSNAEGVIEWIEEKHEEKDRKSDKEVQGEDRD